MVDIFWQTRVKRDIQWNAKIQHPKLVKRQNRIFCVFGFWHVWILNVRALNFQEICPKLEHLVIGDLGPIVWNPNNLVQILDILGSCLKDQHFVPFVLLLVRISDINYHPKSKRNCSWFRTLSKYRTAWNWAKSWSSELSDFGHSLYFNFVWMANWIKHKKAWVVKPFPDLTASLKKQL